MTRQIDFIKNDDGIFVNMEQLIEHYEGKRLIADLGNMGYELVVIDCVLMVLTHLKELIDNQDFT